MKNTTFSLKSNTFHALFPVDVDTRLSDILKNAFRLLERNPEILEKIDQDLDAYALGKKKKRLADAAWAREHSLSLGLRVKESEKAVEPELDVGRPRMASIAAYLFVILRGYMSSLTDRQATERIKDSRTVQYYFQTYGLGALPARTTIHDNVQAISFETREYILFCQHLMILDEDLDDFSKLTLDSTAVRANSCWPTDSGIINDILHRSFKYSQNLDKRFGIPNFMQWFMETWLDNISRLHFLISVTSGSGSKATRRSLYKDLYGEAEKAITHMRRELAKHRSEKEAAHLPPTKVEQLNKVWKLIENDMADAEKVIEYSRARIVEEKNSDAEKVVSLSDGCAAFISKGDRETIVGYRVQVGRSGNGFVTVLHIPEGNANDAPQLKPLVEEAIRNTGITPACVSTDDGYASSKGVNAVLAMDGVKVVSISGSKGKRLTTEEDWESELYREARRNRSSVESLIFVLKYVFGFGKLRRRGIDAVRTELLEKAIVHNFSRMTVVAERKRRKKLLPAA